MVAVVVAFTAVEAEVAFTAVAAVAFTVVAAEGFMAVEAEDSGAAICLAGAGITGPAVVERAIMAAGRIAAECGRHRLEWAAVTVGPAGTRADHAMVVTRGPSGGPDQMAPDEAGRG